MNKVLPLIKEPLVQSYQYHAFPLGVLFQQEEFVNYFVSDYINIRYNILDYWHAVDFSVNYFNSGLINRNREIFIKNSIQYSNKSILYYSLDDFIKTIISMINQGFYVYSLMNAYYLPNRRNNYYQDYKGMDCLIYGYDTNSKILNAMGYDSDGIYKEFQISYEDYFNGNLTCEGNCTYVYEGINNITFFKINPDFKFCFNLVNLRRQLYEYLNSISTTNIDIAFNPLIVSRIDNIYDWNAHSVAYGLQVYDIVTDTIIKEKNVNIGHIRILWEHKKCMYLRLEYLLSNNYLKDDSLLLNYKTVVNSFNLGLNLSIKNMVKFSEVTINKIVKLIHDSVEKEKVILNKVLDMLNKIQIQRNEVKEIWDNIKHS